MEVSVIIVNYNTSKLLINCLKTIYQHTNDITFEIIIVDNNSPDRSIEKITSQFPEVKLLLHSDNAGFGIANNLGADIAQGEYLFFLNPDTLLLNNSIKFFCDFYKNYEDQLAIGALGSILLDEKENINASYSESYITFSDEIIYSIQSNFSAPTRKEEFLNEDYKKVAWVSGADLFIKKDKFQSNKFDENIFMYYEEVDLQKRLNNIGLYNYIIKDPRIIHLEGGSFNGKMSVNKKKIIDTSKFYFYKKHTASRMNFFINKQLFKALSWIKILKDYGMREASSYIKFLNSL
jgi:GT2 family glycosyltransferase